MGIRITKENGLSLLLFFIFVPPIHNIKADAAAGNVPFLYIPKYIEQKTIMRKRVFYSMRLGAVVFLLFRFIIYFWRSTQVVEGGGLLNRQASYTRAWVRIPPSPPKRMKYKFVSNMRCPARRKRGHMRQQEG